MKINNTYFTELKATTKKAQNLQNNFFNSDFDNTELYHVYNKFSDAKLKAMEYCKNLKTSLDGMNGHIISYNSQIFTYGFEFENPKTGVIQIAYITPTYNYVFDEH